MDRESTNEQLVDDILSKHFDQKLLVTPKDDEDTDQEEPVAVVEENPDTDDEEVLEENLTPEEILERKTQVRVLKEQGNVSFRNGDFAEATQQYKAAGLLCKHKELFPDRAILYSNRAASELKLNLPKPAIHSASQAIKFNPDFPKGYLRRAKAYELEDKLDESLEDYKKVLELDRGSKEALEAIPQLEKRIAERNEKMKTEMMEKLKDLGNLVLRPFGLSTNNFQMAQDPNTGGYSINFKQN